MLERMWSSSIYFVTYEICKFCCVNSFCLTLLKGHYHYSTPTCITLVVTDIIRYFTIHLSSWWRVMQCGFLFIVKISCQLRPVKLDQLSRKTATLAHALMMEKQLPVPWRSVGLRPGGSEVCYMITQVYGY